MLSNVLLTLLLVNCALVAFAENENTNNAEEKEVRSAMENPDLYQGDIVLDDKTRFAHSNNWFLWPERTIPYIIDNNLYYQTSNIEAAMKHISSKTCIKFKRRTTETHYVKFTYGQGCYSYVGRIRQGAQPISLGYGCHHFGTIVHEIMHAIGFFHHHMRTDRDEYLNIHWQNIDRRFQSQFRRLMPNEGKIYTKFDYDSIMLYGPRAFSKNGYALTMSPKRTGVVLKESYQKRALSDDDATSINKLYGCV